MEVGVPNLYKLYRILHTRQPESHVLPWIQVLTMSQEQGLLRGPLGTGSCWSPNGWLGQVAVFAHQNQAGHELQLLRATPNAGRRPGTENPIRPLSEVQY